MLILLQCRSSYGKQLRARERSEPLGRLSFAAQWFRTGIRIDGRGLVGGHGRTGVCPAASAAAFSPKKEKLRGDGE